MRILGAVTILRIEGGGSGVEERLLLTRDVRKAHGSAPPGMMKNHDVDDWTHYIRFGYTQLDTSGGVCSVAPGSCRSDTGELGDCQVLGVEEMPLLTGL
eukprot:COSAG01_NODE_48947_length_376_cov_1.277978_1_plen_98_part_10